MVVLTPHWHSEGEPGKHTWSGRSAPPLARLDLPSSLRSERGVGDSGEGPVVFTCGVIALLRHCLLSRQPRGDSAEGTLRTR